MSYQDFIRSKEQTVQLRGIDTGNILYNPSLYKFQEFIVERALSKGKFAVFADCGLGKTIMELEWAQQLNKPVIIAAPLAVSAQTIEEGNKFGYDVKRLTADRQLNNAGIYITNYEQLTNYQVGKSEGIVLDESSILKNAEGKTKQFLVSAFNNSPYKFCGTATPSPNDLTELGNHAEFLNICKRTEMLSKYFRHDGGSTSDWYIKGHAVKPFWKWVAEWAIMLSTPTDIGFDGSDYVLPPIEYIEHLITTPLRNNGRLYNDVSVNATNFNQELRLTQADRLQRVKDIVASSNENFIIWVKQNDEAIALKKMIPEAIEVRGSESVEAKEEKLLGFAKDKFRILITKGKIGRYGLNYQNCRNEIFASPDHSWETVYQCIRRVYRYGQIKPVNIHLIVTDTMQGVKRIFDIKDAKIIEMRNQFREAYRNAA